MVASKKVHCAFCGKKCAGKVLRYQDQYYHKQCFELEQQSSESLAPESGELLDERLQVQQPQPAHTRQEASPNLQTSARTHSQTQSQPTPSPAGRTTGEAAPSGRANLYTESAGSGSGSRLTTRNDEPDESDQNLHHRQTTTTTKTTTSSSNQTRVFTSYASRSQNYLNQEELEEEEKEEERTRIENSNNQADSQNSNLENSSLASHRNRSVSSAAPRQATPATSVVMGAPSERLTSGHLNRVTGGGGGSRLDAGARSATLPHSISSPSNGFAQGAADSSVKSASRTLDSRPQANGAASRQTACAGCRERIVDGQALIALDLHWHVWCFKCAQCKTPLHGEYVAKDGKAYCERDYQKLFGITCVYCKRFITGKVLQAGEAHHFHPSCARCSKCGDPFVPGEEMYLQGEVTWHPRCGPGPNQGAPESSLMEADDRSQIRGARAHSPSLSSRSRSRSASPFSYMSRQYGRASPAYAESEALGDLSRIYTISYLNADPNQGYLRRPIEPKPPKSPQFSRPTSMSRLPGGDRSRCSSRSQQQQQQQYVYGSASADLSGLPRERSIPRGMYSVLSGLGRSGASLRARSPSMMNEEAIQLAAYPAGQKPAPDSVPTIERDDFPAPPFPYPDRHRHHDQGRARTHSSSHATGHNGDSHHQRHAGRRRDHEREQTQQTQQQQQQSSHTNGSGALTQVEQPIEPRASSANQQQQQKQERASRPRSREISADQLERSDSMTSSDSDPQFRKEEEELSKIANGIGKIFLQTLKEREKLRAWKRANLDPRNASRTPSATRELPSRLRYSNPTNASPSRDLDRPRPWDEDELLSNMGAGDHSPTRTRSSMGRSTAISGGAATPLPAPAPSAISSSYGYKVVQANRATPKPGYGLTSGPYGSALAPNGVPLTTSGDLHLSFAERQRIAQARANDLLGRQGSQMGAGPGSTMQSEFGATKLPNFTSSSSTRSLASAAHLRRSMPNVANLHHLHQEGPPKLYPYHLLATSNYRLPPEVDRCHLERHLSNEEFQYIFHCDRLDFYRLPEWKRNELKRRARLF